MLNPFSTADSIRYIDDKKLKDVAIDRTSSQLTLSWISTSGLRVSEHLTPELYARLEKVCNKFNLPVNNVEAYVVCNCMTSDVFMLFGASFCFRVKHGYFS